MENSLIIFFMFPIRPRKTIHFLISDISLLNDLFSCKKIKKKPQMNTYYLFLKFHEIWFFQWNVLIEIVRQMLDVSAINVLVNLDLWTYLDFVKVGKIWCKSSTKSLISIIAYHTFWSFRNTKTIGFFLAKTLEN